MPRQRSCDPCQENCTDMTHLCVPYSHLIFYYFLQSVVHWIINHSLNTPQNLHSCISFFLMWSLLVIEMLSPILWTFRISIHPLRPRTNATPSVGPLNPGGVRHWLFCVPPKMLLLYVGYIKWYHLLVSVSVSLVDCDPFLNKGQGSLIFKSR